MADRGKRLDEATVRLIRRLREALSVRKTAREARVSAVTVQKYARRHLKFDTPPA